MFTIREIEEAHQKVKTGADFPRYILEIKEIGVEGFEFQVQDGREIYFGKEGSASSDAKYPVLKILERVSFDVFKEELIRHQEGKTNFDEFVKMCAETGIAYWKVNLELNTCIYYDLGHHEVLKEIINF
ncbi:DUF1398 domain-containing protein [Sphingobacterium endophyticum]|uniref:DUF1398 domain-containing protein n=1 Tax=Sphingobacterium endophyticum TaxID=2546448 RepID=UPI0012E14783|nr:DUF1398 family protein [Sphingobacterium endophyticum]